MQIENLPISKIKPDPNQPRQTFSQERIKEMAQSIKTEGIINPIEVDKNLIIITGEMRWRSAKEAGLETIPCKVLDISPTERFRRQVIENIHHNTMTDWDTAKALQKLIDELPISPGAVGKHGGKPTEGYSQIGRQIGKSPGYVSEKIDILKSSDEFQKAVKKGLAGTFIRAVTSAPPEFKKAFEAKVVAGQFETRDGALIVSKALRVNPEKSHEILAINFTGKNTAQVGQLIAKIIPSLSHQIRDSYIPVNELTAIVDSLVNWLNNNPPQAVGRLHAPRIIINLSGAVAAINAWGDKAKQLKLEKGNQ